MSPDSGRSSLERSVLEQQVGPTAAVFERDGVGVDVRSDELLESPRVEVGDVDATSLPSGRIRGRCDGGIIVLAGLALGSDVGPLDCQLHTLQLDQLSIKPIRPE